MDTPALKERIKKSSIRRRVKKIVKHRPVKRSYPVRKFKYKMPVEDTNYVMEYALNFERVMEVSKNRFDIHSEPKIAVTVTKATDLRDEFSSYCGDRKAIKNWLFYT